VRACAGRRGARCFYRVGSRVSARHLPVLALAAAPRGAQCSKLASLRSRPRGPSGPATERPQAATGTEWPLAARAPSRIYQCHSAGRPRVGCAASCPSRYQRPPLIAARPGFPRRPLGGPGRARARCDCPEARPGRGRGPGRVRLGAPPARATGSAPESPSSLVQLEVRSSWMNPTGPWKIAPAGSPLWRQCGPPGACSRQLLLNLKTARLVHSPAPGPVATVTRVLSSRTRELLVTRVTVLASLKVGLGLYPVRVTKKSCIASARPVAGCDVGRRQVYPHPRPLLPEAAPPRNKFARAGRWY
jgi:hypothetical protein